MSQGTGNLLLDRPLLTSARDDRMLLYMTLAEIHVSASSLQTRWCRHLNRHISRRTVNRRLPVRWIQRQKIAPPTNTNSCLLCSTSGMGDKSQEFNCPALEKCHLYWWVMYLTVWSLVDSISSRLLAVVDSARSNTRYWVTVNNYWTLSLFTEHPQQRCFDAWWNTNYLFNW